MAAKKMKKISSLQNVVEDKSKIAKAGTASKADIDFEIPEKEYAEPETMDIPNKVNTELLPLGTYDAICTYVAFKKGRLNLGFNLPMFIDNYGKITDNPTSQNGMANKRYYETAFISIPVYGVMAGSFFDMQYDIATQYGRNMRNIKEQTFTIAVSEQDNEDFPRKIELIK